MALHRFAAASGLFAAAAAWPSVVRSLTELTISPVERALQTSWCGPPPQEAAALLGHCAVCFAGAAVLTASAIVALIAEHALRYSHNTNGGTAGIYVRFGPALGVGEIR